MKLLITIIPICFLLISGAKGQNISQIKEIEEDYVTYPFSDPNPIPVFGKIYPYYRFDGYTTQSIKTKQKTVILENDYLKIKILPEIGGKIWSVVDKTSGKEMFYDNKVIKFRDISLRGPWTNGGIEFNYGITGHSPSCSFRVDYLTQQNENGSVSCFISDFDLFTRSRWTVEINLPKDNGWFTTSSFWHNGNSGSQPYYSWINTGVSASEDLEVICPGTYAIGQGGDTSPWPLDRERGKNLARWVDNNFGGYKLYYVAGIYAPYFGVYWAHEDCGMMHIAERDEKVGKKWFTWALSDQGKIWEELLTDTNGPYIELQSGSVFHENTTQNSRTPYRQFYFAPYATDVWTEYWFPFKHTGGVIDASLYGVVNISEKSNTLEVSISPLQAISDTLKLYDANGRLLSSQPVNLSIAKTFRTSLHIPNGQNAHKVTLCNRELWSKEDKTIDRPTAGLEPSDSETAYGKYLFGRDLSALHLYDRAEKQIKESLALNPNYLPSLVEMSRLYYRRMDYDSAYFFARKALSIDTYDPSANFEYGRAARQSGKYIDALDGFEMAALTSSMRSAACTELSKLYFMRKDFEKSAAYAQKSLINNSLNIEGLQLLYLCYRQTGASKKADEIAGRILAYDPLNLLMLFEKTTPDMSLFSAKIRCEMPVQSCLELAIWFHSLGMPEKSRLILSAAPAGAEAKYWLAFLYKDTPEEAAKLKEADAQSPLFVFPFRTESKEVFEWAISKSATWKPCYYLALLQRSAHNTNEALALLEKSGEQPDFPPFYSLRAQWAVNDTDKERDLKKAISLDPTEWRYHHQLTEYYIEKKEHLKALQTIKPFYATHRNHLLTALLYVQVLACNRQCEEAEKILNTLHIMPFEHGEKGGRIIYREIKMMLATQALNKGKTKEATEKVAETLLWPHSMGVGKPFDDQIDTRLEDWMNALILIKSKKTSGKESYLKKVAQSSQPIDNHATLLQCIAWSQLGEKQKANDLFTEWYTAQKEVDIREWGERFYKKNLDREYPFDLEDMLHLIRLISENSESGVY